MLAAVAGPMPLMWIRSAAFGKAIAPGLAADELFAIGDDRVGAFLAQLGDGRQGLPVRRAFGSRRSASSSGAMAFNRLGIADDTRRLRLASEHKRQPENDAAGASRPRRWRQGSSESGLPTQEGFTRPAHFTARYFLARLELFAQLLELGERRAWDAGMSSSKPPAGSVWWMSARFAQAMLSTNGLLRASR